MWEFERQKIRERSILKDCPTGFTFPAPYILPDNIGDFPISLLVRMIGMTGYVNIIVNPQKNNATLLEMLHILDF